MTLGPEAILLSTLAITMGAALQAATGLGAGMVAFPLIALISLELVPGPLIFSTFFLSVYMAYAGRGDIRYTSMKALMLGIVGGTIAGCYGLTIIPVDKLGIFFGCLLLTTVAISLVGRKMPYNNGNMLFVGAAAGFMGVTVASGSPFVALLYQHEKGPALRATLAFIYLLGCIFSLAVLSIANRFGPQEMIHGLFLTPGFIIGYMVSGKLARVLDRGYTRLVILIISTVSASALIIKHLILTG